MIANKYEILSVLGQGGMGQVLLCDGPQGLVAVKRMRLDDPLTACPAGLQQFRQEARLLQGLRHPHLVCLEEYVEDLGHGYLVMEYIRGRTLADLLKTEKRPSLTQVLAWAQQLCSVLEFLHRRSILFRDLKPSNVMIDESGQVKLIDFGLARAHSEAAVTATFLQGMGSTGYSPIEQYQGAGGTDERSDIYGLGATLYHALSGQAPPSPVDLISSGRSMPSMRVWNPQVPLWLDGVVLKMLSHTKAARFQSARQAAQALTGVDEDDQETEKLPPLRTPKPARGEGLVLAMAGILTTVALGVLGVLLETQHSQAAEVVARRPLPVVAAARERAAGRPLLTTVVAPVPARRVVAKSAARPVLLARKPVEKVRVVVPALPAPAYPVRRSARTLAVAEPVEEVVMEAPVSAPPSPETTVEPTKVARPTAEAAAPRTPPPFGSSYPGQDDYAATGTGPVTSISREAGGGSGPGTGMSYAGMGGNARHTGGYAAPR